MRLLAVFLLLTPGFLRAQQSFELRSPDERIRVEIRVDTAVRLVVFHDNHRLFAQSAHLQTDRAALNSYARKSKAQTRTVRDTIQPEIPTKYARIPDHFRELTLALNARLSITFRAANDGVAYRWASTEPAAFRVRGEEVAYQFDPRSVWTQTEVAPRSDADRFHTSFESVYQTVRLDTMAPGRLAFSPTLVRVPAPGTDSINVLLTESDLLDYPGLFLSKRPDGAVAGVLAPYPVETRTTGGEFPQEVVTRRAEYLAEVSGPRPFPWRVAVVAPRDADLLTSTLVYRLASPNRLGDVSWLQPGTSTEEWIIGSTLYDVPFVAGLNTKTYLYYIDFAKRFGLKYVMLDAGWSDPMDLFKITPGMDMDSIANYARQQGIGLKLWTLSRTLDRQLDQILPRFQQWGVKGFMTDFMDRDDQPMLQFYERVARAAARYRMFVSFHGAFKPAGFQRTYPNMLTREGALGSEFNAWSTSVTPRHDLLLAFVRMASGPLDYEPGLLDNATRPTFRPIGNKVMSQGTRAHQLALFVAYESALQVFSGNPSTAYREPEFMEFLGKIPATWHDLRVLDARLGQHLLLARRHGTAWYVAGLTDWQPADLTLDLAFLPPGRYRAEWIRDGVNAHRVAADYVLERREVRAGDRWPVHLAPGGGFVARFERLGD